MAITQNTYTGNGSTTNYSFTFPYLEATDIKVSLDGTLTTAYTLANATTIQFNTAPSNGVAIRIYRATDDENLAATFYPGSAIRSADLNDNFTQNLYVTQEANRDATQAIATSNAATTTANTALSNSTAAVSTANTASANASAAVSTANTASSNASAAVATANTASSNATTAVNTANAATATANSAASDAATAISTANSAVSTANTASTNATNAVNTANAASASAASAVSTANTASTNASNAVATANTASTNATTAVNTANSAEATANSAAAAVANAVIYTIVANVAAIPGSPANNTAIEVADSTGIESFTPLANLPAGFVGNSGLSVRIIYATAGSTWNWVQYFPNDPEARYLKLAGGTVTGNLEVSGSLTKSNNNVVTVGDTGTVTSTMIADGTIVDADVNASAAIAGTKISPNFGAQNVVTTGTNTAASFIPTSSTVPTNGVYLPAANSVALSTNGTGRLFVDASGNVGVGVSSPQGTLSIEGEGRVVTIGDSGTANRPIIKSRNTANDAYAYLHYDAFEHRFYDSGVLSYVNGQNTHIFHTSNSERLRITSAGLVGIGTSSPSFAFDVQSGDVRFKRAATNDAAIYFGSNTNNYIYSGNANNILTIATNNVERLRINSSGNVGIGTTSPPALCSIAGPSVTGTVGRLLQVYAASASGAGSGSEIWLGWNSSTVSAGGGITIGGVYNGSGTDAVFSTPANLSSAPTERARIDSAGRLLVGTSSNPGFSTLPGIVIQGTAVSDPAIGLARNVDASSIVSGNMLGNIAMGSRDGGIGALIKAEGDGTWSSTSDCPGRLVFSTTADGASSPTERMRISNAGTININTGGQNVVVTSGTTDGATFYDTSGGAGVIHLSATTSSLLVRRRLTDGNAVVFYRDTTSVGTISVTTTATAYNTSSDYRLKENVTPVTDGITRLQQLKPSRFNFIADPTKTVDGFLAHEVQAIVPEAITGEKDAVDEDGNPQYQGIDQSKLVPLLTAALQEAIGEIESLKARVAALESA